MVAHKLMRTYKIHGEKHEKWAMFYTGLTDIVNDFALTLQLSKQE